MQTVETKPVIKGPLAPSEVALFFPPMIKLSAVSPVRPTDWNPFSGEWDDTPAVRCTALDDF